MAHERGGGRSILALLLAICAVFLGASGDAVAQERSPSTPAPRLSLAVGLGTMLGSMGGRAEYHFSDGDFSAIVGSGYRSDVDADLGLNPLTFGVALRRYLGSGVQRVFVEASYSLVELRWARQGDVLVRSERDYGPGLSVGYRYWWSSGFHIDANIGAAWLGGERRALSIGDLGVGYTWRR